MARKELRVGSVAEAYLALLAERGVEFLFANAGTDFAPIVQALAKAEATGVPAPKPMIAAHKNLAMSTAHDYAIVYTPNSCRHGPCRHRHRQRHVRGAQC